MGDHSSVYMGKNLPRPAFSWDVATATTQWGNVFIAFYFIFRWGTHLYIWLFVVVCNNFLSVFCRKSVSLPQGSNVRQNPIGYLSPLEKELSLRQLYLYRKFECKILTKECWWCFKALMKIIISPTNVIVNAFPVGSCALCASDLGSVHACGSGCIK